MNARTRITAANCPVRIHIVATAYGFNTLGSFNKFLLKCMPTTKLYFGMSHIRVAQMRKLVQYELEHITLYKCPQPRQPI